MIGFLTTAILGMVERIGLRVFWKWIAGTLAGLFINFGVRDKGE